MLKDKKFYNKANDKCVTCGLFPPSSETGAAELMGNFTKQYLGLIATANI